MHVLTENDVSSILRGLSPDQAALFLKTLSDALAAFSADKKAQQQQQPAQIHQPQRTGITTSAQDTTLFMPVSNTAAHAVKVVTLPRAGPVQGSVSVFAASGALKGVLNAAEVTAFRTALAAMTLLARCDGGLRVSNLLVFGAGRQVEWHVRLALKFLPTAAAADDDGSLRRVTVVNRGAARLRELDAGVLAELRQAYPGVVFESVAQEGNDGYAELVRSRLREADAIFCCTPSTTPLFTAADLGAPKTRFISLIGSYKPEMQEIDTETLRSAAQIWVDSKEECLVESGELIRAGVKEDELTEVGELFLQGPDARVACEESKMTLFKCVGFGLMDLVVGDTLLELAKQTGRGVTVDNF